MEGINAWLGGSARSVVRSQYRPALAEFALLRAEGKGVNTAVALVMHPTQQEEAGYSISRFLRNADFRYLNPGSGRWKTYPFQSVKTQAVAAARKALPMGSAVVFCANKRGSQGAIGIAEELLEQLQHPLSLPVPLPAADPTAVDRTADYLRREYGEYWVGTRSGRIRGGPAPRRHSTGDAGSIRRTTEGEASALGGVHKHPRGRSQLSHSHLGPVFGKPADCHRPPRELLTRDIKNLVGRAGRAGASTKGLVICANENQWPIVARVARNAEGETVRGALRLLIGRLRVELARQEVTLTNDVMEGASALYELINGVDATLVSLITEEIGLEAFEQIAAQVADDTFASRNLTPESQNVLKTVFRLRASRVYALRAAGRLSWIRETGARPRGIRSVEEGLLPQREDWGEFTDPVDRRLVQTLVGWAWNQREVQDSARRAFRLDHQEARPPTGAR